MKQFLGITLGAVALVASAARLATSQTMPADTLPPSTGKTPYTDDAFVRTVQQANDQEIAAARYVLASSKNPAVRAFATQMIGDHATSDVELESAARRAHVMVPGMLRTGMAPTSLQGIPEPQLDVAYMQQQIDAHVAALSVLNSELRGGKNPPLRTFANAQASIVKSHLDKAQNIAGDFPTYHTMSSAAPIPPGGAARQPGAGQGSIISPSTPAPSGSSSPNPQPSVGIPGTVPSPGPSSTAGH
jgi:putative membrane protein